MSLLSAPQEKISHCPSGVTSRAEGPANALDRWCRRQVLARLARLKGGHLSLQEAGRGESPGNDGGVEGRRADLFVRNPRFYRRVVTGGSLAAAEAFMDGDWTSDDLPTLLELFARDGQVAGKVDQGWRRLRLVAERFRSMWRRNTLLGSRRNIAAHYDLSNEFYQLWLDPTMNYSSAIFPALDSTLLEASRYKMDLVCQKLKLQPGDHLLEIGTGWGALAIHAAEQYGCRVTTTTISQQQYDYAKRQIAERGLSDRITLLDQDYRQLDGQYDKLVSIEMIEAVGHEYLGTFFAQCNRLIRSGGRMAMQAITIPDQRYAAYRHSVDFIQRYIFPGGALPSLGAIQRAVGSRTSLLPVAMQDYHLQYARTLECWRERFFDRLQDVRRLGFDEHFVRMWDYYLSYCIAGFRTQQIGVVQMEFVKN